MKYCTPPKTPKDPKSLGLKSPMEFLLENGKISQMYLTHTRT